MNIARRRTDVLSLQQCMKHNRKVGINYKTLLGLDISCSDSNSHLKDIMSWASDIGKYAYICRKGYKNEVKINITHNLSIKITDPLVGYIMLSKTTYWIT